MLINLLIWRGFSLRNLQPNMIALRMSSRAKLARSTAGATAALEACLCCGGWWEPVAAPGARSGRASEARGGSVRVVGSMIDSTILLIAEPLGRGTWNGI